MSWQTMYPAVPNSPTTTLTAGIGAGDTSISVADASVFGETIPQLAVIGETEDAETVLITARTGNNLTVTRAVEGTAKSWASGSTMARNFTAKDHNAIIGNINELEESVTAAEMDNGAFMVDQRNNGAAYTNPSNIICIDRFWFNGTGTVQRHSSGMGVVLTGTINVKQRITALDFALLSDPVRVWWYDGELHSTSTVKSAFTADGNGNYLVFDQTFTNKTLQWVNFAPFRPIAKVVDVLRSCQRYYESSTNNFELMGFQNSFEIIVRYMVIKQFQPSVLIKSMSGTPNKISYFNGVWIDADYVDFETRTNGYRLGYTAATISETIFAWHWAADASI